MPEEECNHEFGYVLISVNAKRRTGTGECLLCDHHIHVTDLTDEQIKEF